MEWELKYGEIMSALKFDSPRLPWEPGLPRDSAILNNPSYDVIEYLVNNPASREQSQLLTTVLCFIDRKVALL